MCQLIKVGESLAIVCGGERLDHQCNESGIVYETTSGERLYFKSSEDSLQWYNQHHTETIMGSVCCSVCGHAVIDDAYKLEI